MKYATHGGADRRPAASPAVRTAVGRLPSSECPLLLDGLGQIFQKIMIQNARNPDQQRHVDVVPREDVVDVRAMACQLLRKPRYGALLSLQLGLDPKAYRFLLHDNCMCLIRKSVGSTSAYPEVRLSQGPSMETSNVTTPRRMRMPRTAMRAQTHTCGRLPLPLSSHRRNLRNSTPKDKVRKRLFSLISPVAAHRPP